MSRPLDSEFADAERSPGLSLWRVTMSWQAAQRAALLSFDLTHMQFVLLACLAWRRDDAEFSQRQLADAAGTDPMMTSQVLRKLEAKGLVARGLSPSDARARALTVTPAGVALANRAIVAVEAVDRDYFGVLGDEQPAFARMLMSLTRRT